MKLEDASSILGALAIFLTAFGAFLKDRSSAKGSDSATSLAEKRAAIDLEIQRQTLSSNVLKTAGDTIALLQTRLDVCDKELKILEEDYETAKANLKECLDEQGKTEVKGNE